MKLPSFLVPARDKARHIEGCVASVFAQTVPCEIILSDQGSEDGTREIMARMARAYRGHHKVRLVDCPVTGPRGMAGLNAHLAWLHEECEGDIIMMTSADDIAHQDRARFTVEAFREHNPSFLGTMQLFCDAKGEPEGMTIWPFGEYESGFVGAQNHIEKLTGSSSSTAWARDLVDKYQPFEASVISDVALPFYGILERGFYWLAKPLHKYLRHYDEANTGLEGAIRAAEGDEAKTAQLTETAAFQLCQTYLQMTYKAQQLWPEGKERESLVVQDRFFQKATEWTIVRGMLTHNRVPPIALKA